MNSHQGESQIIPIELMYLHNATTNYVRYAVIFLCFYMLSACVTVEKHPLPPGSEIGKQAAWQAHRANLEAIKIWSLKGRVAGKSNDEGFRAGVRWREQADQFSIDLLGPLGRKVAVINGVEGNVELKTSKGESYSAIDPETLMQDLFGYSLPVEGLRYWMLGIPDPNNVYSSLELDEFGKLQQLEQAGWLIEYRKYLSGEPTLPAFIKISSPNVEANIVIDRWQLNSIN